MPIHLRLFKSIMHYLSAKCTILFLSFLDNLKKTNGYKGLREG